MVTASSLLVALTLPIAVVRCSGNNDALDRARALTPPLANSTIDGEDEGESFWRGSKDVIDRAWRTAYSPKHPSLFRFDDQFRTLYLDQDFDKAVQELRGGNAGVDREMEIEAQIVSLFEEVHPGVLRSDKIFSNAFVEELLEELGEFDGTGIPLRRPNGMNRYGVIVEDVAGGIPTLAESFGKLIQSHLRPLSETLFPESVGSDDAKDHFAFTVRYKLGEDLELKEHRDASVLTINLCLGQPGFKGSELYFVDPTTGERKYLEHKPGAILIHRGGLRHSALPLKRGSRTNLIVWLFGEDGYVRDAEYGPEERMTPSQRWRRERVASHEEL